MTREEADADNAFLMQRLASDLDKANVAIWGAHQDVSLLRQGSSIIEQAPDIKAFLTEAWRLIRAARALYHCAAAECKMLDAEHNMEVQR
jgi:hypothetical protein